MMMPNPLSRHGLASGRAGATRAVQPIRDRLAQADRRRAPTATIVAHAQRVEVAQRRVQPRRHRRRDRRAARSR
jgi:hypothetical protein